MAKKLFTVEEAAAMLGMPVDELTALREKGEVYAYKDGGVWKFREDEIERVKAEREDAPLDFGLTDEQASGIHSSAPSTGDGGASDLGLVLDSGIGLSEKGVSTGDSSGKLGSVFEDLDDLSLQVDEGSIVGIKSAPAIVPKTPGNSDISLSDDSISVDATGGSAIDLTGDDDDLVLSGADSDITKRPADSGINLNPADSGLSLEEPMPIGGSAVDSFQLGEDSSIRFDEKASPDSPTQKQQRGSGLSGLGAGGDDFDFTATPTAGDEDSGSQVIPIDEDEADIGFAPGRSGAGLEVDEDEAPTTTTTASAAAMAEAGAVAYSAPEAPYTVWNVLSLASCAVILLFGGMVMYDLIRNMWSWDAPYSFNSGIIDTVAAWFK